MWILDDDFDASLPLPTRRPRHPADDRRPLASTSDNQLTDPFGAGAHAPNDGVVGKLALVNGVHLPFHQVSATRYRLRILNAAQLQLFNLELSNGARWSRSRPRAV